MVPETQLNWVFNPMESGVGSKLKTADNPVLNPKPGETNPAPIFIRVSKFRGIQVHEIFGLMCETKK
jgi:hypothetical protein